MKAKLAGNGMDTSCVGFVLMAATLAKRDLFLF